MFNQRSSNQFVHLETKFEFLLQELQVFLNSLYNMSNLIMNNILCFSLFSSSTLLDIFGIQDGRISIFVFFFTLIFLKSENMG